MDFSSRNLQSSSGRSAGSAPGASNQTAGNTKTKTGKQPAWAKIASVILLFGVTAIVVLLLFMLFFSSSNSEDKYVNSKSYQAVFLTNGQVYFGNIKNLTSKYVDVANIYYLQVNQQVQPSSSTTTGDNNNVSLVKLGCELHGPQDEMLINRDQVTFWENLKDSGQVVKAINQYRQQNPNGQNCSTSAASGSTNQAGNSNAATNPSTDTSNKKTP
jgi:hypothetical protein